MNSSLQHLFSPYLSSMDRATLWFADENTISDIQQLTLDANNKELLTIITNRYDIYEIALQKGFQCEFNDFTLDQLTTKPERILYHISKEKPLTHYLLNQASKLLKENGELVLIGRKQQGIKTYASKLSKQLGFNGKLKKSTNDYIGCFIRNNTSITTIEYLDDQDYQSVREITPPKQHIQTIYSKPGVFGWNKVDKGTELLLSYLAEMLKQNPPPIHSALDLGCGYGWIFLNLLSNPQFFSNLETSKTNLIKTVATDNNAAALVCAKRNAQHYQLDVDIIAADCANKVNGTFDLILCNPPFHQGFSHDKALTDKFFQQTKRLLNNNGIGLWVVNDFIGLATLAKSHQLNCEKVKQEDGFSVYKLSAIH